MNTPIRHAALAIVASAGFVACAPCPPPPPHQAAQHHHHGPPPGAHGDHGPKPAAHHGPSKHDGPKGKRGDRKPPKEAFEACAELEAGAACTVKTPHGDEAGACGAPPDTEELACRPNKRRPEERKADKSPR